MQIPRKYLETKLWRGHDFTIPRWAVISLHHSEKYSFFGKKSGDSKNKHTTGQEIDFCWIQRLLYHPQLTPVSWDELSFSFQQQAERFQRTNCLCHFPQWRLVLVTWSQYGRGGRRGCLNWSRSRMGQENKGKKGHLPKWTRRSPGSVIATRLCCAVPLISHMFLLLRWRGDLSSATRVLSVTSVKLSPKKPKETMSGPSWSIFLIHSQFTMFHEESAIKSNMLGKLNHESELLITHTLV